MHLKQVVQVSIPEGVKVSYEGKAITVEGPRGKLSRDFSKSPIDLDLNGDKLFVTVWFPRAKLNAIPRTIASHVENMIVGVTKGYKTTIKAAHAHFPIEFRLEKTAEGTEVHIINFFGEKEIKKVMLDSDVTAELSKEKKNELYLFSNNIESIGRTASRLHFSCRIKNKDLRKFLDGIYVLNKGPNEEE